VTSREAAAVRDLAARLRIAEENLAIKSRTHANEVARLERRVFNAERSRKSIAARLRNALAAGRHWHLRYLQAEGRLP
jgi:hypothetical protein